MKQCEAILFTSRPTAAQADQRVPRRCREPAHSGDYCPTHLRLRDVQDLFRHLLGSDWEFRAERWYRERELRAKTGRGR
jgi:hypothetical protein